ncbi:MAG: glycosyltransferase family 39 protein [Rhodopila sp.]|nr:glycosyltransferase family 39 protein [Rhodopila sp.]
MRRISNALVLIVLLAASAGMMLTAPYAGDFSWSDAPRHALNGAFIMDLVRDHPFGHAAAWAMDYYIRYPSLTILFYPPFFYVIEAVCYAIFGVSHAIAQLSVTLFIFLLGVGAYGFSRQWLPRSAALGVALMMIGAPEVAYWGRQVMLDIPAYALGLIAMVWVCAYLRHDSPQHLYLAAAFLLAAIYTKYNAAFLVVPVAAAGLAARGWRILIDRHVLIAIAAGCVASAPAMFMIYKFGSANVGSVAGRPGDLARDSLGAWLFYAKLMPHQLGSATVALAAIGVILGLGRRLRAGLEPWMGVMLIAWFATGYVFFSAISVREPRHDLMALFPVVLLAAFTVSTLAGRGPLGQAAILLLGAGTYFYSLFWYPPPVVAGYREIAQYVADQAPHGGVVMFSGYRDGNFNFDMREHAERRDLTLLRADKELLKIAVERIRGVEQVDLQEAGIEQMLKDNGVAMIVAQQNFWPDLREMARFADVLRSSDFRLVSSFPVTGELGVNDGPDAGGAGRVDVFVPTYPVEPPKGPVVIDLPIIGHKVTGQVGKAP